jgi:dTDP-L-rhamnose 4-epimerase
VRVLDNLDPQVHDTRKRQGTPPSYLHPAAEFILGDIRDPQAVRQAIQGVQVIYHQAAKVGVGQSMYEISRYTEVNALGTAVLLQAITDSHERPQKLIVASSMSIYGEGTYLCPIHGNVNPGLRPLEQLTHKDWELHCPEPGCHHHVSPIPTSETKPLQPTSIYAINKRDQEEMFLSIGHAYNIPTIALRYFNTYGTRQALTNPYTGVAAIFSGRLLSGKPPVIFEDGLQQRDFTHVSDIVQANLMALENPAMEYGTFNVGTGRALSILDVARALISHFHQLAGQGTIPVDVGNSIPKITGEFRAGDIRHCFADISRLKNLGYQPKVSFEEGIASLVDWVQSQTPAGQDDRFDQSQQELATRRLKV